jgi:RNA polymerase sigma factor (sigma-70 family)
VPVTAVPERLTDATLIAAVRLGDSKAYGLLYERHLAAAKRAASYLVTTAAEREDLVAEAFTRVLQVLRSGRGPAREFRPYLLVTMRHAAINAARRSPATALYAELPEAYLRGLIDDPVDARLTGDDAANAFAGLPERWRQVLWYTEVEGASPAAVAPLLGMTPNGVAALAYRAREGLRQAYLRQHLPDVDQRDCRAATDKLAGWVRRSISEPQQRKINAHLSRCPRCAELAAGLTEVNAELQAGIGPVVSWLSMLKGALSATAVKLGAAAAIAAVTAVGVVASEPAGPHGGAPGQATAEAPARALSETTRTLTDTHVQIAAPDLVEEPATPPAAAPVLATSEDSGVATESDTSGGQAVKAKPAKSDQSGQQGNSAGKPAASEKPGKDPKSEPAEK